MLTLWSALACAPGSSPSLPSSPSDSGTRDPDTAASTTAPSCPTFGPGEQLGAAEPAALTEASGLASVTGTLWTHGDSGNVVLYALATDGSLQREVAVDEAAFDLEDLAVAPGGLILGDIGDNATGRPSVRLLTVPIPGPDDAGPLPAVVTTLTWDLGPRDAETLLADPISGDVLVVSKEFDGTTRVGLVAAPLPEVGVIETVTTLAFGSEALPGNTLTTGGDFAPDGTGIVIRTYLDAFVWPRIPSEPWAETFARPPCLVDLETERQGEAIAWAPEGLYTISEGTNPPIWFYPRQ